MLLLAAILTFAPPPAEIPRLEQEILALTNMERARRGLHELAGDEALHLAARAHSGDMLRRNYFDHRNPEGERATDRVARHDREHRRFAEIAENIWMGSGYPPERIERIAREIIAGWMNSHGHRENILRPEVQLIGVGVVVSGGSIYATQVFAEPPRRR
jgi:uncharacterized protein YkwD